jgi:hypothetical protein
MNAPAPDVDGPILAQPAATSAPAADVTGSILDKPVASPTETARRWLMTLLAATLAFVVIGSFSYAIYAGANVMTWLQVVLPVVSGLVGAAGGFYFGQQSQN